MNGQSSSDRAVRFFNGLKHFKGKWCGVPFKLMDWQDTLVRDIFGTLNEEGLRQYRTVFVEIPRKNGKSETAAGIALNLLFADHEPAAEIYGAAQDRDQAGLVFSAAAGMVRKSGSLANKLKIVDSTKRIIYEPTASFYRAIPSDAAGAFGFNASGVIFDEFHTQRNRELFDALTTSTGARTQPLTFIITTAGYDRESICWELHDYAQKVKKGIIDDPTFYPLIFAADEDDDWTDPEIWRKANPSLDRTITEEFLRTECERAKQTPAFQNTFRRLYLNQWTSQESRWLNMTDWDASAGLVVVEDLKGKPCFAGLDLANTTDITAFVMVFATEQGYEVIPHFWIPEDKMVDRERKDRVPYSMWARQGYITVTPGNVVDYEWVRKSINDFAGKYKIKQVAFDPWNASQISVQLQDDGFEMVEVRQGYKSMSPACKEMERLVLDKKLIHGGNPILRWMADNVMVVQDPAGNIKMDKSKSTNRIDGMVALSMGLYRAVLKHEKRTSVYQERGFVSL